MKQHYLKQSIINKIPKLSFTIQVKCETQAEYTTMLRFLQDNFIYVLMRKSGDKGFDDPISLFSKTYQYFSIDNKFNRTYSKYPNNKSIINIINNDKPSRRNLDRLLSFQEFLEICAYYYNWTPND